MSDTTPNDDPIEIQAFTREELIEAGKARGRGRPRAKNCPDCKKGGFDNPKAPGLGYCREHMRLRQRQYRKAATDDIPVIDARERLIQQDINALKEKILNLQSALGIKDREIGDLQQKLAKSQMSALEAGPAVMDDDIKAQITKAYSQRDVAMEHTRMAVALLVENGIDVPLQLKYYIQK